MAIKYTSIINCVVSTEGSDGIMTNYFYYTVLIVNTDGSKEITTGQLHHIQHLLKYIRTPMDELDELQETVKGLREDINSIIEQKMKYIIDSLFPIPDIQDKTESEAFAMLKEAGLVPELDNVYPESTPPNGIVRSFCRNSQNFKHVNVGIIHDVPDIKGLKLEEAIAKLEAAGFTADITYKVVSDEENGIVLNCSRMYENKLQVNVTVSAAIPETKGMTVEKACELLQQHGYTTIIKKQFGGSSQPVGTVMNWISIDSKRIQLTVSIPQKITSRYVDISWSKMADSTGDTYGAIADFNSKNYTLTIKMSYTIGAKSKHQIIGIKSQGIYHTIIPQINNVSSAILSHTSIIMEPNTKGQLELAFPLNKLPDEMPTELSFVLNTTYGFMKKTDDVFFQLKFDW